MMKKHLLFLLTALLCAIGAYAANGDEFFYKGLKYKVISEADKQVEVSGYEGAPVNLTIPSTAQSTDGTYTVTRIEDRSFYECESLTTITMHNTVENIGRYAFCYCTNLEKIDFSNNLISIGDGCFMGCNSVKSIYIPKTLETLGYNCFDITGLENIYVDTQNSYFCDVDGILCTKDISELIQYPLARTEFNIPNSITKIGINSCSGIHVYDLVIPESVLEIGDCAFQNTVTIRTLSLPSNLIKIGHAAFNACFYLGKYVSIPASVSFIGPAAFSNTAIININVSPDNHNYCDIDGVLYNKNKTKLCAVPNERDEYMFPASITSIEWFAFFGCDKIKSIDVPEGIDTIPVGCFRRCENLVNISLPKSINFISDAFSGSSKLSTIHSHNPSPPQIEYYAFREVPTDAIIYVPKGSKAKYEAAEGWNYFHDFREMEGTGDDEPEVAVEPELAMIEYFIDKDPGVGNATKLNTSSEVNAISIPTASVNPGAHLLSVRTCDNEGTWSATVTNALYVLEPMSINKVEYFVDHDPGEGRATAVAIGADGNASFVVPTASLSKGIHELALRGELPNGEWITLFENPFTVKEVDGINDIAWIDDISISRTGGVVTITGESLSQGSCTVEIYDLNGVQLVHDTTTGSAELTYNIDCTTGPVIVKVQTSGGRRTRIVR